MSGVFNTYKAKTSWLESFHLQTNLETTLLGNGHSKPIKIYVEDGERDSIVGQGIGKKGVYHIVSLGATIKV